MPDAEPRQLEDNARLRAWHMCHRDQLEEALAGVHHDVLERLLEQLKDLRSARELVDRISAQNWEAIPADTRLIALHEINQAIMKLREKSGLEPISDALPGLPNNAFRIIKAMFESFSPSARKRAEGGPRPNSSVAKE